MEFSADQEYSSNYLGVRDSLTSKGWKEGKPKKDGRVISVLFTKDGYGMFILYGCEEEIKDEVF